MPAAPVAEAHELQAPVPEAEAPVPVALLPLPLFQSPQTVEQTADGVTTDVTQVELALPVETADHDWLST